jgi:hypothetical protein
MQSSGSLHRYSWDLELEKRLLQKLLIQKNSSSDLDAHEAAETFESP